MMDTPHMKAMGKLKEQVWPVISDILTYGQQEGNATIRQVDGITYKLRYEDRRNYTLEILPRDYPYTSLYLRRYGLRHEFSYTTGNIEVMYYPHTKFIQIDNLVLSLKPDGDVRPEDLPEGPLKDYALLLKDYALEPERMISQGLPPPAPDAQVPEMSYYQRQALKSNTAIDFLAVEGTLNEPRYVRIVRKVLDEDLEITYIPGTFRVIFGDRKAIVRDGQIVEMVGNWDIDMLLETLQKDYLLSIENPELWRYIIHAVPELTLEYLRTKFPEGIDMDIDNTDYSYAFDDNDDFEYTKLLDRQPGYHRYLTLKYREIEGGYIAEAEISQQSRRSSEYKGIRYNSAEDTLVTYDLGETIFGAYDEPRRYAEDEYLDEEFEQYRDILRNPEALQQPFPV